MPSPRSASAFSSFTTICSGVCFENFLMVIHSARPQAAGTTQNNPLKTNGPKNPDPSKTTCQIATFSEQNHSMCAPRARLGTRAIRWAIRQLRFEGATILGLARQLGTTWNTVWSHIKPCLQAESDDPARFAGVRVLGVDEHVWHHQDRRRRGPRELTGIVDHSRGGASHGPLVRPGPRQVWHRA